MDIRTSSTVVYAAIDNSRRQIHKNAAKEFGIGFQVVAEPGEKFKTPAGGSYELSDDSCGIRLDPGSDLTAMPKFWAAVRQK